MIRLFRNIKYFFKNCWKYRNILVKDRDWDYVFIYGLLRVKLLSVYSYMQQSEWQFPERHMHDIKYIKICIKLTDILGWENKDQEYLDKCRKLLFNIIEEKINYWWD